MSSAFYQLCPKHSGTLIPTTPMAVRNGKPNGVKVTKKIVNYWHCFKGALGKRIKSKAQKIYMYVNFSDHLTLFKASHRKITS